MDPSFPLLIRVCRTARALNCDDAVTSFDAEWQTTILDYISDTEIIRSTTAVVKKVR